MKRALAALALLALVGLVTWALDATRRGAEREPARLAAEARNSPPSEDLAPSADTPRGEPQPAGVPQEPLLATDPDRRQLAQPDGPGAPGGMAETITYPVAPKLTERSLSTIPHRVVGAWDDDPDSTQFGDRRAFILVVDPQLSDRDLANLARDVRDSHLDADWLTLRIFDSATAATRPSWTDGGKTRQAHLVAELRRNTAGQGEWLKIRGQEIDL